MCSTWPSGDYDTWLVGMPDKEGGGGMNSGLVGLHLKGACHSFTTLGFG